MPTKETTTHSKYWGMQIMRNRLFWLLAATILLLLFDMLFMPDFFSSQLEDWPGQLMYLFIMAAPLMMIALGMTLVIASGGIDLSVFSIMTLAFSIISYEFDVHYDFQNIYPNYSQWINYLAVPALTALLVATLCGALNGLLVSRANIPAVVATLVLMAITTVLANFHYYPMTDTYYRGLDPVLSLGVITVIFGSSWLMMKKTALGLFIASVGYNARASASSGVDVKNIKLLAYIFCGFCAGLAGLTWPYGYWPIFGQHTFYLLPNAIAAVAIGGTPLSGGRFSLAGSMLGALLVTVLVWNIDQGGIDFWGRKLLVKVLLMLVLILLSSEPVRIKLRKLAGMDEKLS